MLQIQLVLDKLLENRKIAAATHNIYAYRWLFQCCYSTFNPSFLLHSVKMSIVATEIQLILSAGANSFEMKFFVAVVEMTSCHFIW